MRIFYLIILFCVLCITSQAQLNNPTQITTPTTLYPQPPNLSVDSYTRASQQINLLPGFKYGFVNGGATNLLNLNISSHPSFVSSAYLGSGTNPDLINCGSIPTVDMTRPVAETNGNFYVSSSGGACYNIPIVVIPGTGNVQPNLNLSYNSQGGIGLLGVGWNLTGLSAISRTNKTPLHDGVFGGILLSTDDVFALEGNRLFSLNGVYGQSNSTYYTEAANFASVTSYGTSGNGPEKFEVKDKNGNILKYGYDNNSSLKGLGNNTTLTWYLNEIQDEYGNYMKYYYKQLNGEVVIDKIEYTGNTSSGLSPYNKITFNYMPLAEHSKTYINGAEFNKTQLIKDISCWAGNILFKKYVMDYDWRGGTYISLITEVDANGKQFNPTKFCWDNPNDFDGTKTNQTLDANFATSDYADLTTVPVDFDADGFSDFACWNVGTGRFRVYQNTFLNNYGTNNTTINFNKIYDNSTQLNPSDVVLSSSICDENGDSKQEVYSVVSPIKWLQGGFRYSDEYRILKTFYDNNNVIQVSNFGTFYNSSGSVFDVDASPPQILYNVEDFTGDGVVDILRIDNENMYLTTGNSTYNYPHSNGMGHFIRPFNFDGDGVSDYLYVNDNISSLHISIIKFSGSGLYTSSSGYFSISFPNNQFPVYKPLSGNIAFGDLNGDGLDDLVYINETSSAMFMIKNTGNGFAPPMQIQSFTPFSTNHAFDVRCVDVNADGKKDIVVNENDGSANTTTYYAYISYGDIILKGGSYVGNWKVGEALKTFYTNPEHDALAAALGVEKQAEYTTPDINQRMGTVIAGCDIHYADFNGDGIYDQVNFDPNSNFVVTNNVNGEPRLSMTNIYTPMRNNIQIRYANIGSRFSVSNGIKDEVLKPITNAGNSNGLGRKLTNMYCVSHVFNTAGYSGQFGSTTRYLYKNPTYHQFGRGFLCFEEVTSVDLTTLIGGVTTSSINANYILPIPYKQENSVFINSSANGISNSNTYSSDITKIISSTEKDVDYVAVNTSGYFEQLLKTTSTDYLKSIRQSTKYTYDMVSNGNIQSTITEAGWNSAINTSISTYNYTNINGVYKVNQENVQNTQSGQTPYARQTNYNYDGQGRLISKNDQNVSLISNYALITTYDNYNAFGLPTQISVSAPDISSRTSQTIYDITGRFIIKKINAIGDFEEYTYDLFGNKIQSKDITGLVTKYQYDGLGRLIKTTLPNSTQSKITYEWESPASYPYSTQTIGAFSIKTETDRQPYVKEYYTGNKLKLSTESQDFNNATVVTNYNYNSMSQLIDAEEAHYASQNNFHITHYDYDSYMRPLVTTQSINGLNTIINYSYNTLSTNNSYVKGFVLTSAPSGMGNTVQYVKHENNSAGQIDLLLNYSNQQQSHSAKYQFNSLGKPIIISNSFPSTTQYNITMQYDALGNQTELNDPNAGIYTYKYNTLGELLYQATPNGVHNMQYDILGRITQKDDNAGNSYVYEYETSSNGRGALKKITGTNVVTEYKYDVYSRLTEKKETLSADNKIFKSNFTYNNYGQLINQTYPSGFLTTNEYDNIGKLIKIKNGNSVLWELDELSAPNMIYKYKVNNGTLNNEIIYDNNLNLLQLKYGNLVEHLYNIEPKTGNLLERVFYPQDIGGVGHEKFEYDEFDRLAKVDYELYSATYNRATYKYQPNGNIAHKSDCGDYAYGNNAAPYQLTQINNPVTNNISLNTLNVSYNSFRKVSQIIDATTNKQFDFTYGNDEERIKMIYTNNGNIEYTRYYTDNYDREETPNNTYREWNYVYAPTGLCAVYYKTDNTVPQLFYTATDHLGSPVMLIDENNNVAEQYSFDAWGRRRNPADWNDYNVTAAQFMIRGYTMHEMLDGVGIINMNGRIYDPVLGRFLQPDNFVQAPDNMQNFNRYGYCLNNPLKYTDPTGCETVPGTDAALNEQYGQMYLTYYEYLNTQYYGTPYPFENQIIGVFPSDTYFSPGSSTYLYDQAVINQESGSYTLPYVPDDRSTPFNESYSNTWLDNVENVSTMTSMWFFGVTSPSSYSSFENDNMANAMRDAYGINQARNDYYANGTAYGDPGFGLTGLFQAGIDPVEQFIGSYHYQIDRIGDNLQYTITNQTSLGSAAYHLLPYSWNPSSGPTGTFDQTYIFTEPYKK